MNKVLLISPDTVAKKMAGPGIRYFNFSKELSKLFDVTLYIPNKEIDIEVEQLGFKIIKGDRKALKKEAKVNDVLIVQGVAFKVYPWIKRIKKPLIVDIYDPMTLENLELRKVLSMKERIKYHETDLDVILEQLAHGDYFICASEKQKDYWIGMLAALNRVNPLTYMDDASMRKLIGIVPFGMNDEEPVKKRNVLKGVWNGIDKDDKVIIWGGGIWNWFDPLTLIRAMGIIYKKRQNVKLFFMGIGHPTANIDITIAKECIELSKQLGIYDKSVFFNDWVEYEDRQNFLLEADIGISTYFNNLETRYSFRTRILDYLWCELPMLLTRGDFMSELVEREGLGLCHEEKNENELAECILKLLDDTKMYNVYKNNISKIKNDYKWENIVKPIIDFCKNPYISPDKRAKLKFMYGFNARIKFNYYYIRVKARLKRKKFFKEE